MEVVGLGEATPRVLEADEADEEAAWLLAALVFRRKNPVVGSSNLTSRQWFSWMPSRSRSKGQKAKQATLSLGGMAVLMCQMKTNCNGIA